MIIINTFAPKNLLTDDEYTLKTLELRAQALQWIQDQGIELDFLNIVYDPSHEALEGEEVFGD